MRVRTLVLIGALIVIVVGIAALIASRLTPQEVNPAFTVAVDFVQDAGQGNDTQALPLLDQTMLTYVGDHCPKANVAACIESYTPPEWGSLVSAIFRRAAPSGSAWDVEVIANYQHGEGASGVCSLIHVEPSAGSWLVAGWSGFVHCGSDADLATQNKAP